MLFIGDFSLKAKLILLPVLFLLLFFLWRKIKRTKTSYEEFSKGKTQNSTSISWLWPSPPAEMDLEVEQSAKESRLRLYSTHSSTEIFCGLAGFAFVILTLCMLLAALLNTGENYTISPFGLAGVSIVLLLSSYGFCSVETPVTDIILAPNSLIIQRRFAIFFHKSTTYSAHKAKGLTFTANVQNILESTTDQFYRLPDFYLYVKKGFGPSKRFILRCTPKQTGWIVEGLNQWVSFIAH